ncbi:MAG TPA: hypothetical protein VMZ69_02395 [Saprospiraceae bacterium]|nr:hypothetical protein [Saprospiraceae bacterium]
MLTLLLFSCNASETEPEKIINVPEHRAGMLSLYIAVGFEQQYSLIINDSLMYSTFIKGASEEGPQQLIDIIPKTDSKIKIQLLIADRDTTFMYDLKDVDSLRFGLYANKSFMISNQDQGVWFYD